MKLQILNPPQTISITISKRRLYLNGHLIATLTPPQSDQFLWQYTPHPAYDFPDHPTRMSYKMIYIETAAYIAQHPEAFPIHKPSAK